MHMHTYNHTNIQTCIDEDTYTYIPVRLHCAARHVTVPIAIAASAQEHPHMYAPRRNQWSKTTEGSQAEHHEAPPGFIYPHSDEEYHEFAAGMHEGSQTSRSVHEGSQTSRSRREGARQGVRFVMIEEEDAD